MFELGGLISKTTSFFRNFFLNFFSYFSYGFLRKEIGFDKRSWGSLTMKEKGVVKDIYLKAKKHGVKLKITNAEKIRYPSKDSQGIEVSGYFMGNEYGYKPELGIAVGRYKDDWFTVLLHESSHMDQWIDKTMEWNRCFYHWIKSDVYDLLDEWIGGRKMDSWEIEGIIQTCIDLELDCEKRTVDKIRNYGLKDINITEYIQKANSYISFYGMILKSRKWYVKAPYMQYDVWSKMPRIFLVRDKYLRIDEKIQETYEKHCF